MSQRQEHRAADAPLYVRLPLVGDHLIEANAGTGKTYTIALIALRALAGGLDDASQTAITARNLLISTFTRNAAAELRDRIRLFLACSVSLLRHKIRQGYWPENLESEPSSCLEVLDSIGGEDKDLLQRLLRAQGDFDEACVTTLHGFCQQALRDQRLLTGVEPDVTVDGEDAWLARLARDFWRQQSESNLPLPWPDLQEVLDRARAFVKFDPLRERIVGLSGEKFRGDLPALQAQFEQMAGELKAVLDDLHAFLATTKKGNRKPSTDWQVFREKLHWMDWVASGKGPMSRKNGMIGSRAFIEESYKPEDAPTLLSRDIPARVEALTDLARQGHAHYQAMWKSLLQKVQQARQDRRAGGQLNFDDLVYILRDAVRDHANGAELIIGLRERFKLVIVDEFQDTDPAQFEIIRSAFMGRSDGVLVMVGDPKQSIYRFRDADLHCYLRARKELEQCEPEHIHPLTRNWRSHPDLIAASNSYYKRLDEDAGSEHRLGRIFGDMLPSTASESGGKRVLVGGRPGAAVRVLLNPHAAAGDAKGLTALDKNPAARARGVANEIVRLLDHGQLEDGSGCRDLQPKDILVLCRSHGYAARMQEALAHCGVMSARSGKEKVWETPEAEALENILRAGHDPRPGRLRRALGNAIFGYDAVQLQALTDAADEDEKQPLAGLQAWTSRFRVFGEQWHKEGLLPAISQLLAEGAGGKSAWARLLENPRGRRALANLRQALELLAGDEQRLELSPEGLLQRIGDYRRGRISLGDDEILTLEDDGDVIRIMTVHAAKGLEAPVVVLSDFHTDIRASRPFEPVRLPRKDAADLPAGEGADDPERLLFVEAETFAASGYKDMERSEDRAELDRLTYVALTRAEACTLVFWAQNTNWGKAVKEGPLIRLWGDVFEDSVARERLAQQPGTTVEDWLPEDLSPLAYQKDRSVPEATAQTWAGRSGWAARRIVSYSALSASQHPATVDVEDLGDWRCFGRGARTGSYFHRLFEMLVPGSAQRTRDEALQKAWRYAPPSLATGVTREQAESAAQRIVDDWLARPVLGDGTAIGALDCGQTFSEIAFHLPLAGSLRPGQALREALDNASLPEIEGVDWPRFAEDLARMSPDKIHGLLTGSIDLLKMAANGTWSIVDYKTTVLTGYDARQLGQAMVEHAYLLQVLLYGVAARRLVRQYLGDVAQAGEARYLFLRAPAGQGVFGMPLEDALLDCLEPVFATGAV